MIFQDRSAHNAGQKYCRMEHSAILLTFVKLPVVIKTFVLSIFEWPFYTGFTVYRLLFWSDFYKIIEISLTLLKQENVCIIVKFL